MFGLEVSNDPLSVAKMRAELDSPSAWVTTTTSPADSPTGSPLSFSRSTSRSTSSLEPDVIRVRKIAAVPNAVKAYLQAEEERAKHAAAARDAAKEKKRLAPEAAAEMTQLGVQKVPLTDGTLSTYVPKAPKPKVTVSILRTAVREGLASHLAIPLIESSALVQSFENKIVLQPKNGGNAMAPRAIVHRSYKRKRTDVRQQVLQELATANNNNLFKPQFTWADTQAALTRLRSQSRSRDYSPLPTLSVQRSIEPVQRSIEPVMIEPVQQRSAERVMGEPVQRFMEPVQQRFMEPVQQRFTKPVIKVQQPIPIEHTSPPPSPTSPTVVDCEIGAAAMPFLRSNNS